MSESEPSDELARMDEVDVHPDIDRATEPDEEAVLQGLYGPPDADGIYRGGSASAADWARSQIGKPYQPGEGES